MTGNSSSLTFRLALVGVLAVIAFLIIISLSEQDSPRPGATMNPSASANSVMPIGRDVGRVGSAETSDSQGDDAGQGGQAGSSTHGDSVNPTIDRYGVPVSRSLPVVPDASRDAQTSAAGSPLAGIVDRGGMQPPESGVAQNSGDPSQGPGASSTGSAGLPPEGLNPQMSGQAPEAFDPGLPMLPPEATDAGIYGPGPGEFEIGVNGPGPGELENGVPATPPDKD